MGVLLRILERIAIQFIAKIDQEGVAVRIVADEVVDQAEIEELAGQRTFGRVLEVILRGHEGTRAARRMNRGNHEAVGEMGKGFTKDLLDRGADRMKEIGGD